MPWHCFREYRAIIIVIGLKINFIEFGLKPQSYKTFNKVSLKKFFFRKAPFGPNRNWQLVIKKIISTKLIRSQPIHYCKHSK